MFLFEVLQCLFDDTILSIYSKDITVFYGQSKDVPISLRNENIQGIRPIDLDELQIELK